MIMIQHSHLIAILFALLLALPGGLARAAETATPSDENEGGQPLPSDAPVAGDQEPSAPAPERLEVTREAPSQSKLGFAAAAKVGGTFHTIFNELKPFVVVEIEVGLLLLGRRLELDLSGGWAKPPASRSDSDDRLTGGDYSWDIDQDFLSFGLLARYRFLKTDSRFNVYGAMGPRLFLLRTAVTGKSGDESFGENRQYETRFGGGVAVGGELALGPGAILLEVGAFFGNLDGFITGDTSSSTLDVYAGYRFML
jgi:hypothetical protein